MVETVPQSFDLSRCFLISLGHFCLMSPRQLYNGERRHALRLCAKDWKKFRNSLSLTSAELKMNSIERITDITTSDWHGVFWNSCCTHFLLMSTVVEHWTNRQVANVRFYCSAWYSVVFMHWKGETFRLSYQYWRGSLMLAIDTLDYYTIMSRELPQRQHRRLNFSLRATCHCFLLASPFHEQFGLSVLFSSSGLLLGGQNKKGPVCKECNRR